MSHRSDCGSVLLPSAVFQPIDFQRSNYLYYWALYLVGRVDKGRTLHILCALCHRERANAAFSTLSVDTACTLNGNKCVTHSKLFPERSLPTIMSVLVIHITYIKARLAIFALPKNHINYISVPKLWYQKANLMPHFCIHSVQWYHTLLRLYT